jgi:flagellar biosynthesis GTPase FlhF
MKTLTLFKRNITVIVVCLSCFLASADVLAGTAELSSNLFNFQVKLAKNGNAQSQTKVGEMLEAGNGVDKDLKKAHHWYELAAKSGYKPAQDRLMFLDIKTRGYNQAKDGDWLKSIKSQAAGQDRDSMLLLAQMYRQGVGVNKDFGAAKQLLNVLSVSGNMIIDFENAQLNADIIADKKHQQALEAQRAAQAKQRAEAEQQKKIQAAEQAKQAAAKAKATAEANAAAKQETEEEKRKRYEAAMKQLKEQQKLLEQQQKWAEGQKQ